MKILKIFFLSVLFTCKLSAQNREQYVKDIVRDVLESVDPKQQLTDLKSIYYQGSTFTSDTSKIEFFKLAPYSFICLSVWFPKIIPPIRYSSFHKPFEGIVNVTPVEFITIFV
jgi:hypothetical protein